MTYEELATNAETQKHIEHVRKFLRYIAIMLLERGETHDRSKLEAPELEGFIEFTPKLAKSTYNSDEYKSFLKALKPTLDHHYSHNPHHPEHFSNGIDGMNLVDVIEMFCDWRAAVLRHNDGDILRSIDENTKRFNISPQLASIFRNTAKLF